MPAGKSFRSTTSAFPFERLAARAQRDRCRRTARHARSRAIVDDDFSARFSAPRANYIYAFSTAPEPSALVAPLRLARAAAARSAEAMRTAAERDRRRTRLSFVLRACRRTAGTVRTSSALRSSARRAGACRGRGRRLPPPHGADDRRNARRVRDRAPGARRATAILAARDRAAAAAPRRPRASTWRGPVSGRLRLVCRAAAPRDKRRRRLPFRAPLRRDHTRAGKIEPVRDSAA